MCPLAKVDGAALPAAAAAAAAYFINTKQLGLGQHTEGFAVHDYQPAHHAAANLIIRRCYIN